MIRYKKLFSLLRILLGTMFSSLILPLEKTAEVKNDLYGWFEAGRGLEVEGIVTFLGIVYLTWNPQVRMD